MSIIQVSSTEGKLRDISTAIVEQLMTSCTECSSNIIDKKSFSCFDESPKHVTYRARLEGTSETDSGSLISLIEQWVRGGASIIVTGVLMTVDSECSVAISSLSEGECSPTQPPDTDPTPSSTTTTPTDPTTTVPGIPDPSVEVTSNEEESSTGKSSSSNTVAIIGGAVAVIIVLIIAITVVIVVLLLKSRRGEISLKNAEKYVSQMYTFVLILVFSF